MARIPFTTPDGQSGTIEDTPEEVAAAQANNWTVGTTAIQAATPPPVPRIGFITPDFKTGTIENIPEEIQSAQNNNWKIEGTPDYNHVIKVKNNLDLMDKGDDESINNKFNKSDFLNADGSIKNYNDLSDEAKALVDAHSQSWLLKTSSSQSRLIHGAESTVRDIQKLFGPAFIDPSKESVPIQQQYEKEIDKKIAQQEEQEKNIIPKDATPLELASKISHNTLYEQKKGGLEEQFGKVLPYFAIPSLGTEEAVTSLIAGEAPGLARSLVSRVIGGAAGGVETATPQALVQTIVNKDPEGSAESLKIAGTIGAGFGLLGKATSAIVNSTKPLEEAELAAQKVAKLDQSLTELGIPAEKVATMSADAKEAALLTIAEKSKTQPIDQVIESISKGQHLDETINKLDKFGTVAAEPITNKLAELSAQASPAEEKLFNGYSESLEKLIKSSYKEAQSFSPMDTYVPYGKLTLSDTLKYLKEVGEDLDLKANKDLLQKELFTTVRNQLLMDAQGAALKGGPKLLESLSNDIASINISDALNNNFINGIVKPKTIGSFFKDIALHKLENIAAHTVGSAMHAAIPIPVVPHMIGYGGTKSILKYAKSAIGNSEIKTTDAIHSWLNKNINNQDLPSYLILNSIHAIAKRIQDIEPFLKNLSVKSYPAYSQIDKPLNHVLGDNATGLSEPQKFSKLSNQIATLQNPSIQQSHVNELVAPFAKDHPQLANDLAQQYINQIQYFYQIMPKNPNPPKAFQKDDKWQPSQAELEEFNQQVKIASNPFALLDHLKNGTLTPKEVATASILNPTILQHMRDKINEMAYNGKIDLNYQQRLNASILMGENLDQSLRHTQELQSVYNSVPVGAEAMVPPAGKKPPRGKSKTAKLDTSSFFTQAQRLIKQ